MTDQDSQQRPTWAILSQSKPVEEIKEISGVIRVNEFKQFLIIQEGQKEKSTRGGLS